MTTTVVKTIGSTGDYTTLQAWEDACPADLTTADQIWQGKCANEVFTTSSGVLLTISGTTTDAARYLELTTQAGASFRDNASVQTNALRENSANGAALTSTAIYAYIISSTVDFTRISNLQIKCLASTGRGVSMGTVSASSTCDVNNCIIDGMQYASNGSIAPLSLYGSGHVVRNSLIVQRGSGQAGIAAIRNGAKAYNCTFVAPSDIAVKPTNAVTGLYNAPAFKNCAFFGSNTANAVWSGGSTPTFTTCATDAATGTGLTAATYVDCFENTLNAASDFRLKSGSPLIDVGTTDSTNAATDIAGTARPSGSAYDIGCWEFVASSPNVSVSVTGQRITATAGTLAARLTVPLTGQRASFTQGVVTAGVAGSGVTVSITGQRITTTAGALSTILLVPVAGQVITSGQGVVGSDHSVTPSGQRMTLAQGVVTAQSGGAVTVSISGLSMTLSQGSLTPSTEVALTGLVVDLNAGTVTASGGTSTVWTPVGHGHGVWKKI